jgi:hypothetical protein
MERERGKRGYGFHVKKDKFLIHSAIVFGVYSFCPK